MTGHPISQVLLSIEKAFQDEIVTETGLKFFFDPSFAKEWGASVTARIEHLPKSASTKQEQAILDQLSVGDEVAISFQVVADLNFGSDGNRFMSCVEDNPYVKDFRNGIGERLSVYALPKRKGLTHVAEWVGVHQNKYGELITGMQGSEKEMERWLAQFPLGKTDDYTFNNFFDYEGAEYWKCGLNQIFAKRVEGHLVAVGDRIIMKPIEEEVPADVKLELGRIGDDIKIRYQDRGRIISGGKAKNLKKDQVIAFPPSYMEKYEFWNKQYFLIREQFVLGIWSNN